MQLNSALQGAQPHAEAEARAERLLAEYLRMWGLRDPSTIAMHCRLWARQDTASGEQPASDRPPDTQVRAVMREAMTEMENWLNHLAQVTADDAADESRRGMLAMELQGLIDRYPEALLNYETLPTALVEQLQRAARPVVPPTQHTRMPCQPLGELAAPLQRRWWRRIVLRMVAPLVGKARLGVEG